MFAVVPLSLAIAAITIFSVDGRKPHVPSTKPKDDPRPLCLLPPDKSASQGGVYPVCPYSASGLHLLCTDQVWANSTAACAEYGFVPANVNNANWVDAMDIAQQCTRFPFAWIGSFNGYADDPCMSVDDKVVNMADWDCSLEYTGQVLCQEIALTNHTSTIAVTTSVLYGTSTVVVPTFDPAHYRSPWLDRLNEPVVGDSSSSDVSSSDTSSDDPLEFRLKAMDIQKQEDPPCPAIVCPTEIGHWRVVNGSCSAFNWLPADITTGEMQIAKEIFTACGGPSVGRMYVRSYNGVSGLCTFLQWYSFFDDSTVGMTNFEAVCAEAGLNLCDAAARQPAVTGMGVASQVSSTTTTFTTTETTTSTIPTLTSTLTSYGCQ